MPFERNYAKLSKKEGRGSSRPALSEREGEILQLIVQGKSNREIAGHLDLSIHTVGSHRTRIMKTLGVRKAAGLVAYAIWNGML